MKKIIASIIAISMMLTSATGCYGAVDGITKDNYDSYVKPNADVYGYNKGECETPYLEGEEYFYNEYYDHWNVDKVYDASLIPQKAEAVKKVVKKKTNLQIAKAYAKKHYKGYKIKDQRVVFRHQSIFCGEYTAGYDLYQPGGRHHRHSHHPRP